jgi:uncharacterized protein (TIGR03437 family)
VTIDGQPLTSPMSAQQLNVQLPSTLTAGQKQLTVTTSAGTSTAYSLTVNSTQPASMLRPVQAQRHAVRGRSVSGRRHLRTASGAVQGINARPPGLGRRSHFTAWLRPVTPTTAARWFSIELTEYPRKYTWAERAA